MEFGWVFWFYFISKETARDIILLTHTHRTFTATVTGWSWGTKPLTARWSNLANLWGTSQVAVVSWQWLTDKTNRPTVTQKTTSTFLSVAGLDTPTCRNGTERTRENNTLPDLVRQQLLTSGYFNLFSSAKPPGRIHDRPIPKHNLEDKGVSLLGVSFFIDDLVAYSHVA